MDIFTANCKFIPHVSWLPRLCPSAVILFCVKNLLKSEKKILNPTPTLCWLALGCPFPPLELELWLPCKDREPNALRERGCGGSRHKAFSRKAASASATNGRARGASCLAPSWAIQAVDLCRELSFFPRWESLIMVSWLLNTHFALVVYDHRLLVLMRTSLNHITSSAWL